MPEDRIPEDIQRIIYDLENYVPGRPGSVLARELERELRPYFARMHQLEVLLAGQYREKKAQEDRP